MFFIFLGNSHEKAQHALEEVGAPVLMGNISTLFVVIPVIFAPYPIFYMFFKGICLIVLFGVIHGLILSPIVFAWTPCKKTN